MPQARPLQAQKRPILDQVSPSVTRQSQSVKDLARATERAPGARQQNVTFLFTGPAVFIGEGTVPLADELSLGLRIDE